MSEWQPIDTAPKDGTWVLLSGTSDIEKIDEYNPAEYDYGMQDKTMRMSISRWERNGWRDQWDDYYGPEYPAFWMPLPEAPE